MIAAAGCTRDAGFEDTSLGTMTQPLAVGEETWWLRASEEIVAGHENLAREAGPAGVFRSLGETETYDEVGRWVMDEAFEAGTDLTGIWSFRVVYHRYAGSGAALDLRITLHRRSASGEETPVHQITATLPDPGGGNTSFWDHDETVTDALLSSLDDGDRIIVQYEYRHSAGVSYTFQYGGAGTTFRDGGSYVVVPTALPPQAPFDLVAPAAGATGVTTLPTFEWARTSRPHFYRLAVTADPAHQGDPFADPSRIEVDGILGNAYALSTALETSTDHWWQVIAVGTTDEVAAENGPGAFTTSDQHPIRVWRGDLMDWDATTHTSIQAAIDGLGGADVSGWGTDEAGYAVIVEVRSDAVFEEAVLIDGSRVGGTGPTRRIALRAGEGRAPVIEYREEDLHYVIRVAGVPGVTLEGLEIRNATAGDGTAARNVDLDDASFAIVRRCHIHGSGRDAVDARNDTAGVQVVDSILRNNGRDGLFLGGGPGHVVEGNVIFANGDNGVYLPSAAAGSLVAGNVVHGNGIRGIVVFADDTTIRHNVVYGHLTSTGINVRTDGDGNRVRNNTLSGSRYGLWLGGGNATVRNTIFHGHSVAGVNRPGGGGSATFDYNAWWDNATDLDGGDLARGPNAVEADPRFIDAPAGDFHVHSEHGHVTNADRTTFVNSSPEDGTSPCIAAGDPADPTGDELQPHGGRINIGAYGGTPEASKAASFGPPARLAIASDPHTVDTGACSGAVVVETRDDGGTPTPVGEPTAVDLSVSGSGTLNFYATADCSAGSEIGTVTVPANETSATFHFSDTVAGEPVLTVSVADASLAPDSQQQTVVGDLVEPTGLAFATPARTVIAGDCSEEVVVQARDDAGSPAPVTSSTTVALSADSGTLVFFGDPACTAGLSSVSIPAGETDARFHFMDTTAGIATITADATAGGLTAPEQTQTIEIGAPSRLVFAVQPSPTAAGEAITPAVEVAIEDAHGNLVPTATDPVTLAIGTNPAGGTLSGILTADAVFGVATFSDLAIDRAGSGYDLVATAGTLDAATSAAFDVTSGDAVGLEVSGIPASVVAGTASEVTVTARDVQGNRATDYVGTVAFTSSDLQALLPAAHTFSPADAGQVTLAGVVLRTAGDQTVTASDSDAGIEGTQGPIAVLSAAPDHLRLTAPDDAASACGEADVAVRLFDAFGNPVSDPAVSQVTVTLMATSEDGLPEVVAADLQDVDIDGSEATGRLHADGTATLTVTLDAAGVLEVSWQSSDLPGDPADHGPAAVSFEEGMPDSERSTVTASPDQVQAGRGEALVEILPRDGCDVTLGSGLEVSLEATYGWLSALDDLGDGRYQARFGTEADQCPPAFPDPARLTATVEGVVLSGRPEVTSVCVPVSPEESLVFAEEAEGTACAAGDAFLVLEVVPLDDDGLPLPPGQSVGIVEDRPHLVQGGVRETTDEEGAPIYLVEVGSDRCGTRGVVVQVNGVELDAQPVLTFTCPPLDADATTFAADPARVPADGATEARVMVTLTDTCGNPGFGRPLSLRAAREGLEVAVDPEQANSTDREGAPDDATATFALRSRLAGPTGVVATLEDGRDVESAPDLLHFGLDDVLGVTYATTVRQGVVGQVVPLTATLENGYGGALVDVTLDPEHVGLEVLEADGADLGADGTLGIERIPAEGVAVVRLRARLAVGGGQATGVVTARYRAETEAEVHTSRSSEVRIDVSGGAYVEGCECAATGSGGRPRAVLALLLGLALLRRRRWTRSLD